MGLSYTRISAAPWRPVERPDADLGLLGSFPAWRRTERVPGTFRDGIREGRAPRRIVLPNACQPLNRRNQKNLRLFSISGSKVRGRSEPHAAAAGSGTARHSGPARCGSGGWQVTNRGIRSADSRDPSPRSCSARSPRCLICIADPVVSRRDTLANCPPGNSASAGASGNAPALPTMAATAACLRGAGTSVAAPHCCYRALVRRGRRGSSAPRRRRDLDFR